MGIKVSILEQDGVEFDVPTEYKLSALDVLPKDLVPADETWVIDTNEQLVLAGYISINGEITINGILGVI